MKQTKKTRSLTDAEIFDILGIEEENRNTKESEELAGQFRRLAEKNDPENIWMKCDSSVSFDASRVKDQTKDLVAVA